jgi:hypothetical protein
MSVCHQFAVCLVCRCVKVTIGHNLRGNGSGARIGPKGARDPQGDIVFKNLIVVGLFTIALFAFCMFAIPAIHSFAASRWARRVSWPKWSRVPLLPEKIGRHSRRAHGEVRPHRKTDLMEFMRNAPAADLRLRQPVLAGAFAGAGRSDSPLSPAQTTAYRETA